MTLVEFLSVALATWQIVEIWHHSTLFASRRAKEEDRTGFLPELLSCPWCLSVWVALVVYNLMSWWLVYTFAVSRLANLGNDLSHAYCRTPRSTDLPENHKDTFVEDHRLERTESEPPAV